MVLREMSLVREESDMAKHAHWLIPHLVLYFYLIGNRTTISAGYACVPCNLHPDCDKPLTDSPCAGVVLQA